MKYFLSDTKKKKIKKTFASTQRTDKKVVATKTSFLEGLGELDFTEEIEELRRIRMKRSRIGGKTKN